MANRRMFSNRIANSAKFLQMPFESQLLYFHLVLRADDDGVVESYPIIRLLGLATDNFKILKAKDFIRELNEDQVIVITDWEEHNTIRADRKVDSIYKHLLIEKYPELPVLEPKARSDVKDNSARISGGQSTDGISKVKLSKDNNIIVPPKGDTDPDKDKNWKEEYAQMYIDAFNKLFNREFRLTKTRRDKLKKRFESYTKEQISKALINLSKSKYHQGHNDTNWTADPDFLIRNDEMVDKWLNFKGGSNERF